MGKIKLVVGALFFFLFILALQNLAQVSNESWVRIGISFSGDLTALAVSPDYENDKTLFTATSGGGLWISNDRGNSWRLCESLPCDEVVTSIALPKNYSYNQGKDVFLVTKSGHFFSSNNEFGTVRYFYDFALGQNQVVCTSIVAGGITNFDGKLYVGTLGAGVFRNVSGGEGAWDNITYGRDELYYCSSLELTSESPQNLWASALVSGNPYQPIFKFTGSFWDAYASPLSGVDVFDLHIPWDYPQYIYAATKTRGMWYSSNYGSTWSTACDGTTSGTTSFQVKAISTCPAFDRDQELWEGRNDGLRLSTDRGVSCSSYLINSPVKMMEFSAGYHTTGSNYCDAFVGTNSGLYRINCSEGRSAKSPLDVDGTAVAMANQKKGVFIGSQALGLLKNGNEDEMIQYNNFPNGTIPQIVSIALPREYDETGNCGEEGTIFVAANFADSPSDNGVYKSIDFGNSWEKIVGDYGRLAF